MHTRILPASEWHRLAHTDLGSVITQCDPRDTQVIVVEHDGEIVGCWAALTIVAAEGVWVAPEHRGKASVARRLLTGMRRLAKEARVAAVLTGAADERIEHLILEHGGTPLPQFYRLPMTKES